MSDKDKYKNRLEELREALVWAKAGFISLRDMHKSDILSCNPCKNIANENIRKIDKVLKEDE